MKILIMICGSEFARSDREFTNQCKFLNVSKGNLSLKIGRMFNRKIKFKYKTLECGAPWGLSWLSI